MVRVVRSALAALVVATSTIFPIGHSTAAMQGAGQASVPPTSAQIAPFVGNWLVTMAMNAFEATFVVTVKDESGKITATVASDTQPTVNVTDISVANGPARAQVLHRHAGHAALHGDDADA